MRALTVQPGLAQSVQLEDVPPPPETEGDVPVDALALGICGADREIIRGDYGWVPPGRERLIIGHGSLGRVAEAPAGSGFKPGYPVVGIARRPDPLPCPACSAGEWDMCRNGQYTGRGIKQRNGRGSERWRIESDFLVKLDPSLDKLGVLMEPTSIVAKAWEGVERFAKLNDCWQPRVALITGAGPVGLLAALLGQQRGYEMHVMDRFADGPKPALTRSLGATYHVNDIGDLNPDIVIECTGAGSVALEVMRRNSPTGIVYLTGVSSGGHKLDFDVGGFNRTMVLENDLVFGTVNAKRHHYKAAAEALSKADKDWLAGLITRRVPLDRWHEALEPRPGDIKVVLDLN